jgi:hypothetical protein
MQALITSVRKALLSIFLLKIFWNLHEHYNYLQITQIGNFATKVIKRLFGLAQVGGR